MQMQNISERLLDLWRSLLHEDELVRWPLR